MPELILGVIATTLLSACNHGAPRRPEIESALAAVDEIRLRSYVEALAALGPRPARDPVATQRTLAYLKTALHGMGCEAVEEVAQAETDGTGVLNLVVERAGTGPSSAILEIGAHYDTVNTSPGADDNASGVAALLEIARVLAGHRAARRVRLVFYADEESGRSGSRMHVAHILRHHDTLAGAIVLEMIGYATDSPGTQRSPARVPLLFWPPDRGNFIAVVGNFPSGWLGNRFERALQQYVPELQYFSANRLGGLFKDAMRSDHKPYWDAGLSAILVTDTADFRNPHYHRPGDEPATLNYGFLRRVTQATAATALLWAGGGTDD